MLYFILASIKARKANQYEDVVFELICGYACGCGRDKTG